MQENHIRKTRVLGSLVALRFRLPRVSDSSLFETSAEVRIRARELLRSLGEPKPAAKLRGHREYVGCATFSPDGQILATGDQSGMVRLWDMATYQLKATIKWPGIK